MKAAVVCVGEAGINAPRHRARPRPPRRAGARRRPAGEPRRSPPPAATAAASTLGGGPDALLRRQPARLRPPPRPAPGALRRQRPDADGCSPRTRPVLAGALRAPSTRSPTRRASPTSMLQIAPRRARPRHRRAAHLGAPRPGGELGAILTAPRRLIAKPDRTGALAFKALVAPAAAELAVRCCAARGAAPQPGPGAGVRRGRRRARSTPASAYRAQQPSSRRFVHQRPQAPADAARRRRHGRRPGGRRRRTCAK